MPIPEHERWLFENPEALASLERGIQQAASGDVHDLGSFMSYNDDGFRPSVAALVISGVVNVTFILAVLYFLLSLT